ncbi:MAG: lysophospholipid acyltransferase family protein, partial [Planctomycetota bacterium]
MKNRSPVQRAWRRLTLGCAILVGPWILRLLAATWRVRRFREEVWTPDAEGGLPIFAIWHETIPANAVVHRNHGLTALISRHRDGEMISRIIEKLGYRTARGSTTKGGAGALREMLRMAKGPGGFVFTPDGPRGPRRSVAPGTLFFAGVTGRPLVATILVAAPAWHTSSWDRMMIPKPFARVVVLYA